MNEGRVTLIIAKEWLTSMDIDSIVPLHMCMISSDHVLVGLHLGRGHLTLVAYKGGHG
jgi:hypothetical protein